VWQKILATLADNAKHNQDGRTDKHATLRHRHVELCPVGGMALLFFSHFHVKQQLVPNFAPDFDVEGYGEYGYCEWYDYYIFPASSLKKKMSYEGRRFSSLHLSSRF